MYRIALKMLIEDKAKFIGMIMSLSFSSIIITQQMGIFFGLMRRTYSLISDTPQAKIWVMNPSVKMVEDVNPVRSIDLLRIRSIDGVKWAIPFYKGALRARLPNGQFQACNLIGIDAATFIGAPHTILKGRIQDLRKPFTVIVDEVGANDKLAQYQGPHKPKKPLNVGDHIELNDRRATIVGICKVTRTFRSEPVVYTTFDHALMYAPFERKQLSFILAAPKENVSIENVCKNIEEKTALKAYSQDGFEQKTFNYFMRETGIPINFGIAVLLGLLVGAAIAGQIFFNFTTDNLQYLALFTIVGASRRLLAKITLIQGLWVGFLGWGIGSGIASLIGYISDQTQLAFYLSWQLFLGTFVLMLGICVVSSLISINRIFNIQLWSLFKQ